MAHCNKTFEPDGETFGHLSCSGEKLIVTPIVDALIDIVGAHRQSNQALTMGTTEIEPSTKNRN